MSLSQEKHKEMLDLIEKFGPELHRYIDGIDAKELNWGGKNTLRKRDKVTFSHPRLKYYKVMLPRIGVVYNYTLDEMSKEERIDFKGQYVSFDEFTLGYFGPEGHKVLVEELNNFRSKNRGIRNKELEIIRRDPFLESQLNEKGVNNEKII